MSKINTLQTRMVIEGIELHITRKRIKGVYLRILPPDGKVVVSAPFGCSDQYISNFVISKQDSIFRAINKIKQKSGYPIEYNHGDLLSLLGVHYVLCINEGEYEIPSIEIDGQRIILTIKDASTRLEREAAIYSYYKDRLKQEIDPLIDKWERIWGVQISGYTFRKQKTLWGSCNRQTKKISFNIELIKYPLVCIEYIVAHELLHILIPGHGIDFKTSMSTKPPNWRELKNRLKEKPVLGS